MDFVWWMEFQMDLGNKTQSNLKISSDGKKFKATDNETLGLIQCFFARVNFGFIDIEVLKI